MSKLPAPVVEIQKQFGPTLAYARGTRLDTGVEPDRIVKPHCCFCGQQCGIQLKVLDNEVWTSLRLVDTEIRYRCHLTEVTDGKIVHTGVQG
jgi:anaerobic selenocysteine-containing dehydrogenase